MRINIVSEQLTGEQRTAATHGLVLMCVIAGRWTGKSILLVRRA